MKYSYSQIRTFGKCQYKWHLNYKEGLIPPPSNAMSFGKFGHKMIENILLDRDILHDIVVGEGEFDMTEMDEIQDMIDDARSVVELFLDTLPLSDWETVTLDGEPLVEKKLEMDLGRGSQYIGYIDWVARHKPSGQVWLWDFKFRGSFLPDWTEELDLQKPTYMKHLYDLGVEPIGTISCQIKNKAPKVPTVTKKGGLSKAKITTTWETYLKAVVDNGLDPADYADMKEKLDGNSWFQLSRSFRHPEEIDRTWNEVFLRTVDKIEMQWGMTTPPPRSIDFMSCNMCQFRDICIEDLKGRDTEDLKALFNKRENRNASKDIIQ